MVTAGGPAGPLWKVTTMSVARVTSISDVELLAAGLLDAHRERPWGVITIPVSAEEPLIDVEQLHDEAGDVCQFFVIQTGTLTRKLAAMLPDRCQVYGGASRIYPVGVEWMSAPELSPLRFMHDTGDAAIITDRLVADALSMAHAAGLFAEPASTSVRASGEVRSLLAGGKRALVQLDSGGVATIVHELTFPEVPLEWVIREGQIVDGQYDPQTKRLTIDVVRVDSKQLLEHYPHGTVTLAYVVSVERQSGVLAVHPSVPITVTRGDVSSNPFDRVDLLLAPGDVVHVRVVRDEQGRTRLRLSDIDDDETIQPALALAPGSDPWLAEERHKPESEVDPKVLFAPEPYADVDEKQELEGAASPTQHRATDLSDVARFGLPEPRPAPGPHKAGAPLKASSERPEPAAALGKRQSSVLVTTQLALQQERDRTRQLEAQLKRIGGESALEKIAIMRLELGELHAENYRLRDQLHKMRSDQRALRTMLRKVRRTVPVSGYSQRRQNFDCAEDWVRHEIYLAWIDRLDAGDRKRWPLPKGSYVVGERFAASLELLDDPSRDKALKAVVDVLTGRARELPARNPHPLRTGEEMSAADVVRADGARCMRVHIEKKVASARRLHYWQSDDGVIELSRIVLHDDMEP